MNKKNIILRNKKINQKRYGVSLIFDVNENCKLKRETDAMIECIENNYPKCFVWYPHRHISLVRCNSVREPFETEDYLYILENASQKIIQKSLHLEFKYINIGDDGVIRLYYCRNGKLNYRSICEYYDCKKLKYNITEMPWISLGNITLFGYEEIFSKQDVLIQQLRSFDLGDIEVSRVKYVYYEDVLLKKCKELLSTNLS